MSKNALPRNARRAVRVEIAGYSLLQVNDGQIRFHVLDINLVGGPNAGFEDGGVLFLVIGNSFGSLFQPRPADGNKVHIGAEQGSHRIHVVVIPVMTPFRGYLV